MTLQEKLAQRIYELLPNLAGEWFIIDPEKIHYIDLVDKQVQNTDKEMITVTSVQPVIFGSTLNDGEGIKLYSGFKEWYIYKKSSGIPNKVTSYREINDIRLADLLMAIEKVLDDNHICYVNSVGAVYVLDMNKSYQKQFEDTNYGEYNLSKDNILDQSDEFCEFVLELLK